MSSAVVLPSMFPEIDREFAVRCRTRVYFGLGQNGQLKIGITSRANGRRGGEMHFTELCSVPGERGAEEWYHAKYRAERIGRTEWFMLSDRILLDLVVMCVGQYRTASVEILKGIILARLQRQEAA
jgi:hypothetical protein